MNVGEYQTVNEHIASKRCSSGNRLLYGTYVTTEHE